MKNSDPYIHSILAVSINTNNNTPHFLPLGPRGRASREGDHLTLKRPSAP